MEAIYGHRHELKVQFNVMLLTADEKTRLAQDLIRDLLLSDTLNKDRFNAFRRYLESALKESE